ncbi:MAG: dihydropteroate synthase [Planctomycetaceae bacterium]|nr:dihydropteroate synthase [Planctomycetaceae bacterium]
MLRAASWRLRTRTLEFARLPRLMGIVNVTPDSFSDGGKFLDTRAAVDHALRLLDDGADILDIGGESTRPYAAPVSTEEELARVLPVIGEVRRLRPDAILSIDTSKAAVAEAAIAAGAEIINDVTGLVAAEMIALAARSGAGVCSMHMQGTPQTMQDNPFYDDVVEDIYMYLCQRRDALAAAGIARERICLDPGIGFGKTHQHNLALMRGCGRLHDLGCPLLVGHSRKGFIGKVAEAGSRGSGVGSRGPEDRLAGTIGGALALARQGVQIVRVHDVRQVREALVLFEACGGMEI